MHFYNNTKKNSKWKGMTVLLLAAVLTFSCALPAMAVTKKQLQDQKNKAQRELNNAEAQASELAEQEERARQEAEEMDEQLVTLITAMNILDEEMTAKRMQIEQAELDYAAAKEEEEKQYESMKKRIRFMYEQGDSQYLEIFLSAQSIADVLNKADFVGKLYDYDRQMLVRYQDAKQAVADYEEELLTEESEMQSMQDGYKEQQVELEDLLNKKLQEVEDFDAQLAKAKKKAKEYENQIKEANSQIAKIAAKEKAEAEARRKAEEEAKRKAAEEAKRKAEEENKGDGTSETPEEQPAEQEKPEEPEQPSASGGSGLGRDIANYALQFVGNPYVSGGTSLTNGTDCSGFTMSVYKHFGYSIPRTSGSQACYGKSVSYSEAQPGDIMCYPGHVGIYIGNGMIVHASTPATGIKTSIANYRPIMSIRRIVN